MNLEFPFAKWEVSGGEIVNASFTIEFDGREFLLIAANGFARFCETSSPKHKSQPNEWNFAIGEALRVSDTTQVNPQFVRSLFEDKWKRGEYGRIVFFREDLVFLGRDGQGFVLNESYYSTTGGPNPYSGIPTPFQFDLADEFDALPASFWPAQLEEWDADEHSDFRFARDLALSDENGVARLTLDISGGWLEMARIAHLILETDSNWNNANYANFYFFGVRVTIKRHELPILSLVCAEYGWEDMEPSHFDNTFHQPGELWNIWLRYFVRGFDEELLARHLAGDLIQSCNFVLSCKRQKKTAHEKMDLLLQLRDWLQGKVSPERIAELLR